MIFEIKHEINSKNNENNNKSDYKCTIIYNSNGGEGTMKSDTYKYGDACIIRANEFIKKDHSFIGWTTNSNGVSDGYNWTGWKGVWTYKNGQYGIKDNKLILYAMWRL